MNVSKHRFEFFSDGVMAIIITIMVLEIPLPNSTGFSELPHFLFNILIFFVSFFIVGSFWNKHHWIIDKVEVITSKLVWRNMVFLFFLALLPLLTRWVLENPNQLVPLLCYDILFILVSLGFFFMGKEIYVELETPKRNRLKDRNHQISNFIVMIFLLVFFIALFLFFPEITLLLFLVFPIISSLIKMFIDER